MHVLTGCTTYRIYIHDKLVHSFHSLQILPPLENCFYSIRAQTDRHYYLNLLTLVPASFKGSQLFIPNKRGHAPSNARDWSTTHSLQVPGMSFEEIFDLTAGVYLF